MKNKKTIFIGLGKPTFPIPVLYRNIGKAFAQKGHQVHLIVHHDTAVEEETGNPTTHFWQWRTKFGRLIDIVYLAQLILKHRPDCVIAAHRETKLLVGVGFLLGVPHRITWYHTLGAQIDVDSKRSKWNRWLHRVSRIPLYRLFSTRIYCPSNSAAKDVQKYFLAPVSKCRVMNNFIYDPIESKSLNRAATQKNEERIVCPGRMDKSKGQDVLMRAIPKIREKFPLVKIYFLGTGPYAEEFKKLSQDLSVSKQCVFVGDVEHQKVLEHLLSASVSVIPSRIDNLPTTVVESLACGVPIISTLSGGIPEMLDDGQEGFFGAAGRFFGFSRKNDRNSI